MNWCCPVIFACVLTCSALPGHADTLTDKVQKAMGSAYIKTDATSCVSATVVPAGWPAGLVDECIYVKADVIAGHKVKHEAIAQLVMPKASVVADWIRTACARIKVPSATCHKKLVDVAHFNTGFQFVVGGNVLEDLNGNGRFENYSFRNGITTSINPGFNGSEKVYSLDEQRQIMLAADEKIRRMKSGKARYWLTLPAEMKAAYPALAVPADVGIPAGARAWAGIVRDEFIAALGSSHNRLLEAALCARSMEMFGVKCGVEIADVAAPVATQKQKILACQNLMLTGQQFSFVRGEGLPVDVNTVQSLWVSVLDRPPDADTAVHEVRFRLKLKAAANAFSADVYCIASTSGGEGMFECPVDCDGGSVALRTSSAGGFQFKIGDSGVRLEDCDEDAVTISLKNSNGFVALAAASSGQCPMQ